MSNVPETLTHGRCCSAGYDLDAGCTCGLQYRIQVQTEQTMHAAWRKRAEEAEAALTQAALETSKRIEELDKRVEGLKAALDRADYDKAQIIKLGEAQIARLSERRGGSHE